MNLDAVSNSNPTRQPSRGVNTLHHLSISVVIAWVNPLELLTPCLESLGNQSRRADEVIIVTRRNRVEQERLQSAHPSIILVSAAPDTPITRLRAIGIKRARGSAIAITEDHCVPCSDWISTIEHEIRQGCGVVGGPVENACTNRMRDWAAFLTEYAGSIGSATAEKVTQLPGNNVAYRKELIDGLCATLDGGLWESFYHQELYARGDAVVFEPRMLVHHQRTFDFWYFVKQRFYFCRSFAAMRCQSMTALGRVTYGIGSAILPPLLLLRGLRTLLRKQRLVQRYICCLP